MQNASYFHRGERKQAYERTRLFTQPLFLPSSKKRDGTSLISNCPLCQPKSWAINFTYCAGLGVLAGPAIFCHSAQKSGLSPPFDLCSPAPQGRRRKRTKGKKAKFSKCSGVACRGGRGALFILFGKASYPGHTIVPSTARNSLGDNPEPPG